MDYLSILYDLLPSGYLLHSHGKIHHFLIGKPSISMGHLYHGYAMLNNQMADGLFVCLPEDKSH